MKTRFIIFFTAIIFTSICFSQVTWTSQNSGTNSSLDGVYFVDENNGWVSGWIGIILHTTDGGQTWGLQNTPANYGLYTVFFTDLQNGWAAGYSGDVVHTTNGGETWTLQDNLDYEDIYKLFFVNANRGWAAGGYYDFQSGYYDRVIYNTTNGGNNWNLQYSMSYETELHSIYFTDSNTGYAAGGSGIMKTTNGGSNWFVQQSLSSFGLADIFFTNSTTGFVTGEYEGVPHYSVIFKTTDGGNNWNEISLGTNEALSGLYFTDELNGWAVGNDYSSGNNLALIYHTTDGGNNWVKQSIPSFDALSNVFFINDTKGWAVGTLGTIITADNPTPVELTSFNATVYKNNVTLNWQTATETNNKGFEIERKMSVVRNQESEWTRIGFVQGHGTSTQQNNYSFVEKNLEAGSYSYKLVQIDLDGTRHESKAVNVEVNSFPTKYALLQNYPNPFNPTTTIEYSIPQNGNVTLKIYNELGEEVRTLENGYKETGSYTVNFNAANLSSGIYYYKLSSGNFSTVKKMIFLK
jgi:photosystem II stability/assembly factor-like uncharacterized protein